VGQALGKILAHLDAKTFAPEALRVLEERLAIAKDNAVTQRRSYEIADVRYRHGIVSELDPSQALSLLKSTESTIPQLESRIRQSRHALSILLGMPPGNLQDVLQGPGTVPSLRRLFRSVYPPICCAGGPISGVPNWRPQRRVRSLA
jgi:hypothetical protein